MIDTSCIVVQTTSIVILLHCRRQYVVCTWLLPLCCCFCWSQWTQASKRCCPCTGSHLPQLSEAPAVIAQLLLPDILSRQPCKQPCGMADPCEGCGACSGHNCHCHCEYNVAGCSGSRHAVHHHIYQLIPLSRLFGGRTHCQQP